MSEDLKPILSIRDLTVDLPRSGERRHAVEGVSFSVPAGKTVCVVGESGSGKSVTAFSVMGLLPRQDLRVSGGEIALDGAVISGLPEKQLRRLRGPKMAMIFQEPMTALNPLRTVGEHIDEVFRIHTALPRAERHARGREMLLAMELQDADRIIAAYPHQLSGGQRQRVMIASAMALDPMLLIADEPTTALDVTTQAQILALIKDMQARKGTGVLFITHDLGVVAEIADLVVVMREGRVVEQGDARSILQDPKHDYTKMLLAAIPGLTPRRSADGAPGDRFLKVQGLSKVYGQGRPWSPAQSVTAARDISFCLARGETVGVVGESGSGKTTVARCVARLQQPSAGTILLGDADIAQLNERGMRPFRRRVQIVFQDPYRSLNPRRTVGASIIEGPMNFGTSQRDAMAKALSLLSLVGLSHDAIGRYPHQFSGGQRQRIAIARALAMEPELLIADEAVSALDVSVQAQILRLFEDIQARFNLGLLFITHDLRVAAQICNRIIVMKSGEIVESGDASSVLAAPRHAYTRQLIAAAPGRGFDFGAHARGPSLTASPQGSIR